MLSLTNLYGFGAARGGFPIQAITFNGSAYLTNSTDTLTDSTSGIASVWVRLAASDESQYAGILGCRGTETFDIYSNPSGTMTWALKSTGGTSKAVQNGPFRSADGWLHMLMAWDASNLRVYVNGVSQGSVATSGLTFDNTTGSFGVGSTPAGGGHSLYGDLAEVFVHTGATLDITDAANQAKFRSASGKPVDLGADGSLPLGVQPKIYLSSRPGDAASAFGTNLGSGGNFTMTGTLAIASTPP
jgi:hypothetical protein